HLDADREQHAGEEHPERRKPPLRDDAVVDLHREQRDREADQADDRRRDRRLDEHSFSRQQCLHEDPERLRRHIGLLAAREADAIEADLRIGLASRPFVGAVRRSNSDVGGIPPLLGDRPAPTAVMDEHREVLRTRRTRQSLRPLPPERAARLLERIGTVAEGCVLERMYPVRTEHDLFSAGQLRNQSHEFVHRVTSPCVRGQVPEISISRMYALAALLSASTCVNRAVTASRTAFSTSGHVRRPAANCRWNDSVTSAAAAAASNPASACLTADVYAASSVMILSR